MVRLCRQGLCHAFLRPRQGESSPTLGLHSTRAHCRTPTRPTSLSSSSATSSCTSHSFTSSSTCAGWAVRSGYVSHRPLPRLFSLLSADHQLLRPSSRRSLASSPPSSLPTSSTSPSTPSACPKPSLSSSSPSDGTNLSSLPKQSLRTQRSPPSPHHPSSRPSPSKTTLKARRTEAPMA